MPQRGVGSGFLVLAQLSRTRRRVQLNHYIRLDEEPRNYPATGAAPAGVHVSVRSLKELVVASSTIAAQSPGVLGERLTFSGRMPSRTLENLMADRYCPYGDSYATHRSMRRRNTLIQYIVMHGVPPLLMLWELVKYAGKIFPETWNKFVFPRFWGEGILTTDAYFVMDSYEDVRLRSGFSCGEAHPLREQPERFTESEIIHGTFSPQAAAMLTALFLRHTGKLLRITTDTEVGHKMDATLICYGTSDSNFKTFDIEASSETDLCRFSFNGNGQRAFRVGGQLYSIENRGGVTYDKAILLRLTSRQNSNHCHVVCAGLSEWGSLAAVYYLTKKWKVLHKRFDRFGQRRDFCVLLEIPCGQFENAREITSAVWWEPKMTQQSDLLPSWRA
jgi:hypothetical protein